MRFTSSIKSNSLLLYFVGYVWRFELDYHGIATACSLLLGVPVHQLTGSVTKQVVPAHAHTYTSKGSSSDDFSLKLPYLTWSGWCMIGFFTDLSTSDLKITSFPISPASLARCSDLLPVMTTPTMSRVYTYSACAVQKIF